MRHITTTISGTRNMNITQWQCSLDPWLRSTALHTDWYTLYSSNIHCSSLKRQDQNVLYHTTAMLALRTSTGLKLLKLYASVPLMLLAWLKVKFVLRPRITEKTLLITQHVCVCVCLLCLCVWCCVVFCCRYVHIQYATFIYNKLLYNF